MNYEIEDNKKWLNISKSSAFANMLGKSADDKHALKSKFDMLQIMNGTNNLEYEELKEIVYFGAIGKLDDEVCRSEELNNHIKNMADKLIKNTKNYKHTSQLDEALYLFLTESEAYVKMLFDEATNEVIRKAEKERIGEIAEEDIEKMSLDEYKMEVAEYYMMSYTKYMDDEYLKRFIKYYDQSLEEFYDNKIMPMIVALLIATGFH